MTNSPVSQWFNELKRIWLEKDISGMKNMLADDFKYYEDPFQPPLETWQEVETAWQEVNEQDIKKLEIEVLIDGESEGSGSYDFAFADSNGDLHESKGAYYLKLDAEGKAVEFKQWWTAK